MDEMCLENHYRHFTLLSSDALILWFVFHGHSVIAWYWNMYRPLRKYKSHRVMLQKLEFLVRTTATCHQQPHPLTCGVSSECLGTRSYETTSRDQRGKIQMCFSWTGACTAAKFSIANHYSQINTQLYSASLIRHIWQQRHSDSEFDAL